MICLRKIFNISGYLLFAVSLLTPSAMAAMGDTWSKLNIGGAHFLSKSSDGDYLSTAQFAIIKFNEQGAITLNMAYRDGPYGLSSSTIKQTTDGGYILAGSSNTSYGALAIKTDSSGNMIWNKVYGWGGSYGFAGIEQTTDGGYIGIFHVVGNLNSGLAKINLNGDVEWYKTYDGAEFSKFVKTQDGGYLLIGTTRVYGAGGSDGIVIRTNSVGDIMWQKTYGGQNQDSISSVISLASDEFILAGSTSSFGNGDSDIWIFNIDGNGNVTSQKTYGTTKDEWCESLIRTSDGGLAMVGYNYTPKGYFWGQPFEQFDALVAKLDSTGNFVWQKTYGVDYRFDQAFEIVESSNGGFMVSGVAFPGTNAAAWVFKTDQSGNIFGCRAYRFYINNIQMQQHDISLTTTAPSIIATLTDLSSRTATGVTVQNHGIGGSGTAQCVQDAPQISTDNTSVWFSFGDVVLGKSASRNLIITNIGNSDLSINDSYISWTNASEFGYTNNCSTLAPNDSCNIEIQFNPTSPGIKTAGLSFSTNDPFHISYTQNLIGTGVIDNDNDNYSATVDCNDNNSTINPGADEVFNNGVDENCNGLGDDVDNDLDGYSAAIDCNDNNLAVHPGVMEIPYNGIDDNCSGMADDDDLDQDGFGVATDCKDNDPIINPSATEIYYNGIDENCQGMADDDDVDGDGYLLINDCNDSDTTIHPNASEIFNNGIDDNCSGMADDADLDQDGFGVATDCKDNDPTINPSATEIYYNGIDENCQGMADDDDVDGDGYLLINECNDSDATIHPGAYEIFNNGIDENCNGPVDDAQAAVIVESLADEVQAIPLEVLMPPLDAGGSTTSATEVATNRSTALQNMVNGVSAKLATINDTMTAAEKLLVFNECLVDLGAILIKTDGFYGGHPANDWVTTQAGQDILYPRITSTINFVQGEIDKLLAP